MTAVRQRKGSKGKEPGPSIQNLKPECITEPREWFATGGFSWWTILCITIGSIVGVSLGLLCCIYVATLHENDLWFSNIKEVEREISFRTECGLYYSYYKQMLKAPSVQQGLYELIHDNTTESKRTINILQRMNIYQEVFLSILYRILPIQTYLEPIYFYIYTVFALQTVYVFALFITSWLLSDSWLAGALSGVWYILNRVDTTRVEFTISLRENWSIPFFALQVAAITCYLRPQLKPIHQIWLIEHWYILK
ncbi:probable C-mannosyltransferase DPY19L3 [Pimephales promelas]|uniref:probable C-mannosyltransferase DPY19L3 n=1 Tax=Pimephales promelas TaxID=90988 RepID=UPI00195596E2|nr:probable C-mannosyltransferase DPY19L3 [Pimephales promelas]